MPDVDAGGRFELASAGVCGFVLLAIAGLGFGRLVSTLGSFLSTFRSFVGGFFVAGHGE